MASDNENNQGKGIEERLARLSSKERLLLKALMEKQARGSDATGGINTDKDDFAADPAGDAKAEPTENDSRPDSDQTQTRDPNANAKSDDPWRSFFDQFKAAHQNGAWGMGPNGSSPSGRGHEFNPFLNAGTGFNPFGAAGQSSNPFGGMGGQGFNPFGGMGGQGFNPFGGMGGQGFNPFGGMGGQGFNPFGGMGGQGFNPFGGMGGQGFNPFGGMGGQGFNPFGGMGGQGFNPFGGMGDQGFNPFGGMGGQGFNPFERKAPGQGDETATNPFDPVNFFRGWRGMSQGIGGTTGQYATNRNSRSRAAPESLLVALHRQGEKAPFFCIHAMYGSVFPYHKLALYMTKDRPVYGIRASGLEGESAPLERIPDMARLYVDAIRSVQSNGPYHVGGYSFGGWVAFEAARLLVVDGYEVATIALLGTPVPLTSSQPTVFEQLDIQMRLIEDWQQFVSVTSQSENQRMSRARSAQTDHLFDTPMQAVAAANNRAQWRYVPRPIARSLDLFMTEEQVTTATSHGFGWERLCTGETRVHHVSGNHISIFHEPDVVSMAQALSGVISQNENG